MAQAFSSQPQTAASQIRSWANSCGIFGGQSGTGQVLLKHAYKFIHSSFDPI